MRHRNRTLPSPSGSVAHFSVLRVLGWFTVLAAALAACDERQEARHPTFDDAVASGAVRRGWIPDYVPRNATDIVEIHDLDSNAQYLRFRVSPEAMTSTVARLTPEPARRLSPPPRHLVPRGSGLWRPDFEAGTLPEGWGAYRAPSRAGGARCVAIDARESTVHAWTCE